MNPPPALRTIASLTAMCLSLAFFGCAETARWMREATYPPDFRYISQDELESVMWRLAGRVHELETLMGGRDAAEAGDTGAAAPAQVDTVAVSRVLANIEREARALEADGGASTHPYFHERLDEFLAHVEHARRGLQRNPPVTTSVDDVWRACAGCHNR